MKSRLMTTTALIALSMFMIACSKGGGGSSSGGTATTASVIQLNMNPTSVAPGGSMVVTPSGGTAPYFFTLNSGAGGTLTQFSGLATTFIASTNGALATLTVTDSASHTTQIVIPTTGAGTLGGLATGTGLCQGNYALNLVGTAGSLQIISDSVGNIAGNINIQGGVAAIQGTCVNGQVSFFNQFSGSAYVGSYGTYSATGKLMMQGNYTDVYGNVSGWQAFQQ